MSKLHIKKGDTVYVNAGEDKGKTGRVLRVLVKENRAVVEGINMVSKHTKPNAKNPQGGIVKMEAPIHISNLNLLDPKSNKATRIGRQIIAMGKNQVFLWKTPGGGAPTGGDFLDAFKHVSSTLLDEQRIQNADICVIYTCLACR